MGAKKKATASSRVQRFNSQNKIGTRVRVTRIDNTKFETNTRSVAFVSDSGYPVILIDGVATPYNISLVEVIQ